MSGSRTATSATDDKDEQAFCCLLRFFAVFLIVIAEVTLISSGYIHSHFTPFFFIFGFLPISCFVLLEEETMNKETANRRMQS
jgi:hypothetical protein